MKHIKSILVAATLLVSFSSFAAQQITREEAAKYTKVGEVSVTQDGTPIDNSDDALSKAADAKGGKYYVIIDKEGQEDHKTIDAEVYK